MSPKRPAKSANRKSESTSHDSTLAIPRPARSEWIAIALLVVAAGLLRLLFLSHAAVEHFDEGVYASNLFMGAEDGYRYPDWELYAPPLLPALLEWSQVFLGTTHLGTMLVSILAGTATVALVWWTARAWFGPKAGLAAAALAVFSDYHILYSRAALTDVLLGFWLIAAVYAVWEAFRRGSFAWSMAAGVLTSLAWWTKYNGWLPLAVAAAGIVPWVVFDTAARSRAARLAGCWLVMAAVAFALWTPALLSIPEPGYAAVQANHRTYLVGLDGWFGSLIRQIEIQRFLTGWLSCIGLAVTVLAPRLLDGLRASASGAAAVEASRAENGAHRMPLGAWIALALLAAGIGAAAGAATVVGLVAAFGIAVELLASRPARPEDGGSRGLAVWLLAAWFVGLLVATPLYRPYSRLLMPWVIASWIGSGAAVAWWYRRAAPADDENAARRVAGVGAESAERSPQQTVPSKSAGGSQSLDPSHPLHGSGWGTVLAGLVGLVLLGWSGPRLVDRCVPGWQRRDGLEPIAARLVTAAEDVAARAEGYDDLAIDFVIYVHGEPGLYYHISRELAGRAGIAQPAGNLGFAIPNPEHPDVPTFLAIGPHALRSPGFQQEWTTYGDRFREIATYEYRASDLVLLDEYPPSRLTDPATRPVETVQLYLLEPQR